MSANRLLLTLSSELSDTPALSLSARKAKILKWHHPRSSHILARVHLPQSPAPWTHMAKHVSLHTNHYGKKYEWKVNLVDSGSGRWTSIKFDWHYTSRGLTTLLTMRDVSRAEVGQPLPSAFDTNQPGDRRRRLYADLSHILSSCLRGATMQPKEQGTAVGRESLDRTRSSGWLVS